MCVNMRNNKISKCAEDFILTLQSEPIIMIHEDQQNIFI